MLSSMFKCRPLNVMKKEEMKRQEEKEWCKVQENMKKKRKGIGME